MKVGDLVKIGGKAQGSEKVGVIIRRWGGKSTTHGRAWYVLTDEGRIRAKLTNQLEVIK